MSDNEPRNAAFYTQDASTYDTKRWESRGGRTTRAIQERLFREMTDGWTEGRILEVGSGTGRFAAVLAERHSRLVLVDVATGMLPVAVAAVRAAGSAADPVVASVRALPFAPGTFDRVVCLNVLNHVEDLRAALSSLAGMLAPAGELLFNYANRRGIYWPVAAYVTRRGHAIGQDVPSRWDTRADVRGALSAAGLVVEDERGHVHAPRSIDTVFGDRALRTLNSLVARPVLARWGSFGYVRCRRAGFDRAGGRNAQNA